MALTNDRDQNDKDPNWSGAIAEAFGAGKFRYHSHHSKLPPKNAETFLTLPAREREKKTNYKNNLGQVRNVFSWVKEEKVRFL